MLNDANRDKFLLQLLASKDKIINPEILVSSKLRYPSFQEFFDLDDQATLLKLGELESTGLLKKVLWGTVLACPSCKNLALCTVLSCPNCGSTRVEVTDLVSCPVCKYKGRLDEFYRERTFRCPRCNESLSKRDLIREYRCQDCNSLFSTPEKVYYCPVCKGTFKEASLEEESIFSYYIINTYVNEQVFEKLREILSGVGDYVDVPGIVVGRSGVRHVFTGVARTTDEVVLAVEILVSDVYVGADHVLRSLVKVLDVSPKRCVLIAIPKVSSEAREILKTNRIELIESSNVEEAINSLKLLVREIL